MKRFFKLLLEHDNILYSDPVTIQVNIFLLLPQQGTAFTTLAVKKGIKVTNFLFSHQILFFLARRCPRG